MPADLSLPAHTLSAFVLVMTRMGGIMTFLPVPGLSTGPLAPRILFTVSSAFLMFPVWWRAQTPWTAPEYFVPAMLCELVLGLAIGLAVAFLAEALNMAAQMLSLQAGYSYASTIDPNTQAEAGYLVVLAQLMAGLMFFTSGLDRQVLAVMGRSFERVPPGACIASIPLAQAVGMAASNIFRTGLQLALPVIALLAMADIALALIGRLNQQLQVTTIGFPVKMLATLALLAWIATLIPMVYQQSSQRTLALIETVLGAFKR